MFENKKRIVEKSPHWDEVSGLEILPGQTIPGYPFDEGWPRNKDGWFDLILTSGRRILGRIDLTCQYRSEGIEWRDTSGLAWNKHVVAAWRTHEDKPVF